MREIYGCIEYSLLWYNLYVNHLKYLGFSINTYYGCLTNKIIDRKQCTIICYVDDNNLLRVYPNVVTDVLE